MNSPARAKLQDVARHAGVSTATVSRYLNNPSLVAPATVERIRQSVAELNYIPNLVAGSLASSRSRQIAVMVPYLRASIVEEMVEDLVETLEGAGMVTMLMLTAMDPERTNAKLMTSIARQVEAVVTTGIVPEPARTALIDNNMTVIEAWGLPDNPVDVAIGFSHRAVGTALAEYAAERGYRRPHLVTSKGIRAERRRDAFVETWAAKGLPAPTEGSAIIPSDFSQARTLFAAMQSMPELPDLVICGSDFLAQGLIVHAAAAGLSVPKDFAVIGFGNSGMSAHMSPSITSVDVDGKAFAQEAIKVIEARAKGEEIAEKRIDIGFRIVQRESA